MNTFNNCSKEYATFRPSYPESLFSWIKSVTDSHEIALDVGTGNGQAALGLVNHYQKIIATDASFNQLLQATKHNRINYFCMLAEKICLLDNSVDLIISASAAHWFDLDRFYDECKRIMKPSAKIILWTYTWPNTEDHALSTALNELKDILAPFWSDATTLHINKYTNLPFPFTTITTPHFEINASWNLEQISNFFLTWATIQSYIKTIDPNFKEKMKLILKTAWPMSEYSVFKFPLHIKFGNNK